MAAKASNRGPRFERSSGFPLCTGEADESEFSTLEQCCPVSFPEIRSIPRALCLTSTFCFLEHL